jgi:putative endopeptidase
MEMPMPRLRVVLTCCVLAAGCAGTPRGSAPPAGPAATPAPAPAASPAIGPFGVDLAGRDEAIRPGDDFYRYAGGRWMASAQLPPDRVRWGSFDQLAAAAEAQVHGLLEELAAQPGVSGDERKAADFYAAFVDTATIEARGLAPLERGLAAIAHAANHDDVAALMARPDLELESPISLGVSIDRKDPDRYVAVVGHAGLGLPEREFYLRDDAQFKGIRAKYLAHLGRAFQLLGDAQPEQSARAVLELETEIARRHWPIAKRRERDLTYNLRTRAELDQVAPGYPWGAALAACGLAGQDRFVVAELDAMAPLAELFRRTPVATWQKYLRYHYLRVNASVLPKAVDDEFFAFYGHELNGQPEQRVRWKRAVAATNGALGEAVGKAYVSRHFPPAAKAQVLALVENLRRAYAERIDQLSWMSPATKAVAKEKLATFRPKIGYPDRWKDYSAVEIARDDAFGNRVRASVWDWERQVRRIGEQTDRDEWFMVPQSVNAYYNPTFNEIVFPAAILQPPFFDPAADPAVNYGAIGGVIGHEMGHGFDDQGAKSDAHGILRTWWSDADVKAFRERVDRLAAQYEGYEALPGLKLNGRLTLGENIGDLGGLSVAHEAFRISLHGRTAPVVDGLTADQRFFLGWAQVWRELIRDEALRNRVLSDPHSPGRFRVNGVVRNMDAWYEAFGVRPGDALYVAPADRVRIW